jgi:hypothetical protein
MDKGDAIGYLPGRRAVVGAEMRRVVAHIPSCQPMVLEMVMSNLPVPLIGRLASISDGSEISVGIVDELHARGPAANRGIAQRQQPRRSGAGFTSLVGDGLRASRGS